MSALALPLGAGKTRIAALPRRAVRPLLAPKRLLQLVLIALIAVPIPSDDGPFKPYAPAVTQARAAMSLTARMSR